MSVFCKIGKRNKKQKQERRRLTTFLHFQNPSLLPGPGVASFFFHFVPAVFSCSNTRPRSYTTFSPLTTFCHGYSPTSTFVSVKASLRKPRQCLEAPLKSSFPTFPPLWSHTADVSHLMIPLPWQIRIPSSIPNTNTTPVLPPSPWSHSSPHHRTAKARVFVCFLLHTIAPRLDLSCSFCFVVRLLATCFILRSEL